MARSPDLHLLASRIFAWAKWTVLSLSAAHLKGPFESSGGSDPSGRLGSHPGILLGSDGRLEFWR